MSLDEDDSGRFTELRKKWSAELRYEPEATQSAHVERGKPSASDVRRGR